MFMVSGAQGFYWCLGSGASGFELGAWRLKLRLSTGLGARQNRLLDFCSRELGTSVSDLGLAGAEDTGFRA